MGDTLKEQVRIETHKRTRLAKATTAMFDTDNDGYLSSDEIRVQIKPISAEALSTLLNVIRADELGGRLAAAKTIKAQSNEAAINTTILIDDMPIMNEASLTAALATGLSMDPKAMEKIVHHTFPKGVAELKLSDMCSAAPELNCTGLPNHKVLLSMPGNRKS